MSRSGERISFINLMLQEHLGSFDRTAQRHLRLSACGTRIALQLTTFAPVMADWLEGGLAPIR
jgi:hypothetical protein